MTRYAASQEKIYFSFHGNILFIGDPGPLLVTFLILLFEVYTNNFIEHMAYGAYMMEAGQKRSLFFNKRLLSGNF